MAREKLGEILIRAGLLDEMGLQRALNEQQRWGGQLGRYLVELGLISEEILVRALSTQYKLPAVALDPPKLSISVGRLVPKTMCERYNLVCFRADPIKKFIDVAMSDPSNVGSLDEVRVATKCNVRPYIAAPTVIDKAISFIFYGDVPLGSEVDLSPDSVMRIDPQTSEFVKKPSPPADPSVPPAAGPPVQPSFTGPPEPWTPGVIDLNASVPQVKVKISPTPSPSDADEMIHAPPVKLPPAVIDDNFHITLDVPAVDKERLVQSMPPLEERLALLEATVRRNSSILQLMLDVLLKKGLLSQSDILRILRQL